MGYWKILVTKEWLGYVPNSFRIFRNLQDVPEQRRGVQYRGAISSDVISFWYPDRQYLYDSILHNLPTSISKEKGQDNV